MILSQLITGLADAASLFLIAAGLSLIFGVTRIVNFAHGSFYMLGAYIGYTLISAFGGGAFGFWGGIILASLAVGAIGAIAEISILRRIYRAPELYQLLATFALVLVIQDAALAIWGPVDILGPLSPGLSGAVELFGSFIPEYDLFLIIFSPLVLAALWYISEKTRWGMLVRAATEDREMLGALGVNQAVLFTGVFFVGSALAGLGGAIQLPKGGADLLMDLTIVAPAFVVVVVGGMGSIPGAFLAAVIIKVLNAFAVQYLPEATLVSMFAVMAIVLVLKPEGLFGAAHATRNVTHAAGVAPVPKPTQRSRSILVILFLTALILPAIAPYLGGEFILVVAIEILIAMLFAASLHFMMGPGGMVSFGHALWFGAGAYAAGLLVTATNLIGMEAALILAPVITGLLALAVGWFCVRLSGIYLAMLTLASAQIGWAIVVQWYGLTGGDDGILGIWPATWASSRTAYYYLTLALCAGGLFFLRKALYAPFGYVLRAGRDSLHRSEASGIDVRFQQWMAFAFSGAIAGLAGTLFVFSKGSIFPDELAIPRSVDALIMVLLGGVQSVNGPLMGAAVFTGLHDWFSRLDYWRGMLGAAILVIVLLLPDGIAGLGRWGRYIATRIRGAA